jgi:hypothetical protein
MYIDQIGLYQIYYTSITYIVLPDMQGLGPLLERDLG